jgi:hypothetical protein
MYDQDYDALIEIEPTYARVQILSLAAREWLETHVTLDQVHIWDGSMLEIAPCHIGALITGMLDSGLVVATGCDHTPEPSLPGHTAFFLTYLSLN